jgi:hypothetical protein
MLKLKVAAFAAFGAFVLSGPLQYVGATPETVVGDASKEMIKSVVESVIPSAHAGGLCSAAKARARAKALAKAGATK